MKAKTTITMDLTVNELVILALGVNLEIAERRDLFESAVAAESSVKEARERLQAAKALASRLRRKLTNKALPPLPFQKSDTATS